MISGLDRNEQHRVRHLYDGELNDPGLPMCRAGWNRDGGFGYSILRGPADWATCLVCRKRAAKGLKGVEAKEKTTKWL